MSHENQPNLPNPENFEKNHMASIICALAIEAGVLKAGNQLNWFKIEEMKRLAERVSSSNPEFLATAKAAIKAEKSILSRLRPTGFQSGDTGIEFRSGKYIRDYPAEAESAGNLPVRAVANRDEEGVPITNEEAAALNAIGPATSSLARGKYWHPEEEDGGVSDTGA